MLLNIEKLNKQATKHVKDKAKFYDTLDHYQDELLSEKWENLISLLLSVSPQKSSPFIEKKIIIENELERQGNLNKGDAILVNNKNEFFEIKHSLVKKGDALNLVQIRPWQKVNYIFYIFDLDSSKLYKFNLTNKQIKDELRLLGTSAHGTQKSNEKNKNVEKAIRIKLYSEDFLRWVNSYKPEIEEI
jgi:hypothetical protein